MKKVVYCPVNGWDCPYYKKGLCTMYPEFNPLEECDDFFFFWDGSEEEDFVAEIE